MIKRQELEAWLLADDTAWGSIIARIKHPHPVGKLKHFSNPDCENRPKEILEKAFEKELGKGKIYRDHKHALSIAKAVGNDWRRMANSDSFKRFALHAAGVKL